MAIRGTYRISPVENRRLQRVFRILSTAKTLGYKMGRRKYFTTVILFLFLAITANSCILFTYAFLGLTAQRGGEVVITSINLTENSIIIEVERGAANSFRGIMDIYYKNIPGGLSLSVWIDEKQPGDSILPTATLTADLTDIPRVVFNENDELKDENGYWKPILYINQEARFFFSMQRAVLEAEVFIGEDRIDIIEQRFFFINGI